MTTESILARSHNCRRFIRILSRVSSLNDQDWIESRSFLSVLLSKLTAHSLYAYRRGWRGGGAIESFLAYLRIPERGSCCAFWAAFFSSAEEGEDMLVRGGEGLAHSLRIFCWWGQIPPCWLWLAKLCFSIRDRPNYCTAGGYNFLQLWIWLPKPKTVILWYVILSTSTLLH